ncbi:hypothetical protein KAU11_12170, partial [Candidatus Babeliales bacterium]|nr:hypothetical protein [Candidatus Babeliales bacterium]
AETSGTLGSSCMRYRYMTDWFQIYADNARMVVILKDNKVMSRAILWDNVTNGEETITFLDRIYGVEKSVAQLKAYAEEKGYFTKVYQSYSEHDIELDGNITSLEKYVINLKNPTDYDQPLPYLDSFPYGKYKDKKLVMIHNSIDNSGKNYHSIRYTNGGNGTRTCIHCGGTIHHHSHKCLDCGEVYDTDYGVSKKCPECGETYTAYSYDEPHLACVLKKKYKCTDCNEIHIANSQAEFDAKTCKEGKWTQDGGMETSTTPDEE